jgi:hypothetical protein
MNASVIKELSLLLAHAVSLCSLRPAPCPVVVRSHQAWLKHTVAMAMATELQLRTTPMAMAMVGDG